MLVVFAVLPFVSTALGGLAAMRFQHRLHPIMAFAAGVLVATALVDLLPEAAEQIGEGANPLLVGGAAMVGYLLFSLLEAVTHRQSMEHQHPPQADPDQPHEHLDESRPNGLTGFVGAGGLIVHSTLDGLAIGLGFQAGAQLGLIVALAVLAHDFADGMNVVTLVLAQGSKLWAARTVLLLDAVAPPVGVLLSTAIAPPGAVLGTALAAFAGVFVAIGAGHLLPEANHRRPDVAPAMVACTALGAVLVGAVRSVIG
ncbi:MAG TPA: ZIP family metal transporter [Chloroflexota bacterium]|nr:ZIP family metal transporter [Chloroflexota bacterium]